MNEKNNFVLIHTGDNVMLYWCIDEEFKEWNNVFYIINLFIWR